MKHDTNLAGKILTVLLKSSIRKRFSEKSPTLESVGLFLYGIMDQTWISSPAAFSAAIFAFISAMAGKNLRMG